MRFSYLWMSTPVNYVPMVTPNWRRMTIMASQISDNNSLLKLTITKIIKALLCWPLVSGIHQWASCQIRKIAGCACAGNAGNVFPTYRLQRKPQVSDPGMHHGTCVTHVPWCMSESLIRGGGENVPGIPGACATRNFAYLARGPWPINPHKGPSPVTVWLRHRGWIIQKELPFHDVIR